MKRTCVLIPTHENYVGFTDNVHLTIFLSAFYVLGTEDSLRPQGAHYSTTRGYIMNIHILSGDGINAKKNKVGKSDLRGC